MNQYPYDRSDVTARALQMVTQAEMEAFEGALSRGHLPADLQDKLEGLQSNDPRELYLKQQSQVIGWLLMSLAAREYRQISPLDGEKLVRMLAYVRKEDDAIPDAWPGGMVDDHDLMRMTCAEFREVLNRFKAWHLSRRVPSLWAESASSALQNGQLPAK